VEVDKLAMAAYRRREITVEQAHWTHQMEHQIATEVSVLASRSVLTIKRILRAYPDLQVSVKTPQFAPVKTYEQYVARAVLMERINAIVGTRHKVRGPNGWCRLGGDIRDVTVIRPVEVETARPRPEDDFVEYWCSPDGHQVCIISSHGSLVGVVADREANWHFSEAFRRAELEGHLTRVPQ